MILRRTGLVVCLLSVTPVFGADLESILDAGTEASVAQKIQNNETTNWFLKHFKKTTPAQEETAQFINRGEWTNALLSFSRSVEGTQVAQDPSIKAFESWLIFKSGLKITSIEALLKIKNLSSLDEHVKALWHKNLNLSDSVWGAVQIEDAKRLEGIFPGIDALYKGRLVSSRTSISQLRELVSDAPAGSALQAKAQWNLILALSLANQSTEAAAEIAKLMKIKNQPVSQDLLNITAARLLYQNSHFDAASKYYLKVPKRSDLWVEAQEELAWTYLRKGDPANAVAVSKDLLHPGLKGLVSPEMDLVIAMGYLRLCDYKSVLENINGFAKRYKLTNRRMMKLAEDANDPAVLSALSSLESGRLTAKRIGRLLHEVPRSVLRDESLYEFARNRKVLKSELQTVSAIENQVRANRDDIVKITAFKNALTQRSESIKTAALARVSSLAQKESQEIQAILKKMHIVEAEVMEQMAISEKIFKDRKPLPVQPKIARTDSTLVFPDEGEAWFDEISYAKVNATRNCVR